MLTITPTGTVKDVHIFERIAVVRFARSGTVFQYWLQYVTPMPYFASNLT